jgi:hypothetical protein
MTGLPRGAAVGLLILLGVLAAGVLVPAGDDSKGKGKPSPLDPGDEPGGTAEAAGLAVQDPDEYAWRLFLFLSRQARPGYAGVADPKKAGVKEYDDDKDVVWETWALASSDALPGGSEVFLAKGAKPVAWDKLDRARGAAKKLDHNFTAHGERLLTLDAGALRSGNIKPFFALSEPEGAEVRVNRPTFDTIRDKGWYSREGLAATFAEAKKKNDREYIQFPPGAKEVKAFWLPIKEDDKGRYHWRALNGKTYGLKALHVITKDLPYWFWCDFIHTDLEPREPTDSIHDATTRGPKATHGKDGVRAETAGSKWSNYRLKGSQVAFTDARGNPTHLGDQLIEHEQAARSSCITCHAMASIDAAGGMKHFSFCVGPPTAAEFGDKDIVRLQTDFLYSMPFRAHSTKE